MLPQSEDLEGWHERVRGVAAQLAQLRGAEVTRSELIAALAELSREWLRFSTRLRNADTLDKSKLEAFDTCMSDVLKATRARTRSSAYLKRIQQVQGEFLDAVVVPLIKYEGSPTQVAGRQLQAAFTADLSSEEQAYVEEASRCVGVRCYRAAIIMLWAAAIARMHRAVENVGFAVFNAAWTAAAAKKGSPYSRATKAGSITSLPELQRMRDFDLLVIGLELWGYDMPTFEELERALGTRNGAAHPGMLQPGALDVQQFATKLNSYVFEAVKI